MEYIAPDTADDAARRLATFRSNGGFWYYSSDYASTGATHIYLPAWYATFADWVKAQPGPTCSQPPTPTRTSIPTPTRTPTSSPSITGQQATNDATNVSYRFQYSGTWNWYRVYIDTDQNSSTGFATSGIGANYLVENGNLYRHAGGGWNWTLVKAVPYSNTNNTAAWTVARADIGETAASEQADLIFKVVAASGDSASLPKFTHIYTSSFR
jgi:hypothetical protein